MVQIPADLLGVALRIFEGLDTPRSLTCALLAKHGEWDQLATLSIDPSLYTGTQAEKFRCDALATGLLKKLPALPTSWDRKEAAISSFLAAERQCKATNDRLVPFIEDPLHEDCDERIVEFIDRVRKRIRRTLGRVPNAISGTFGPGATFETEKLAVAKSLTLGDKLEQRITFTAEALCLAPFVWETAWGRNRMHLDGSSPQSVRGDRFVTVPKDGTKDRGITIQPGGNLFLQLGIGAEIRRKLSRCGIDIVTGQQRHRAVLMQGGVCEKYATIDLSSASDTICKNLVKLLLPEMWYEVLSSLRSPFTRVEGRWHRLEKFSAMGNGFTFELETLIFWAISAEAASSEDVSVYGDDILVPVKAYRDVVAALRWFGFTPNPKKSFSTGYFRESCGVDVFNDVNVRGFSIKEVPADPPGWIRLANQIFRWTGGSPEYSDLRSAWFSCINLIPIPFRVWGDESHWGDLVLGTSDSSRYLVRRTPYGVSQQKVLQPLPRRIPYHYFHPSTQMTLALLGYSSEGLIPRSDKVSYRTKWMAGALV